MKKLSLFILSLLILSSSSTLLLSSASAQSVNCLASPPSKTECSIFGQNQLACEQIACFLDQQKNNPSPWYMQTPTQFADKVLNSPEEEVFGERYTLAQINWIINSLYVIINPYNVTTFQSFIELINVITTQINSLDRPNPTSPSGSLPSFERFAQLGPTGIFAYGIASFYANPPASAIGEIKHTASRLIDPLTPSTYAQGVGFSGLNNNGASAVRALWTASRNAAYIISAILLIASGLMVMFRVKLNPQTVISVQQMIPKLIMTLLLITFSFAIAGLVIDLIYVFLAGITGFLSSGTNPIITNSGGFLNWISGQAFVSPFGEYVLKQILWFVIGLIFIYLTSFAWILLIIPQVGLGVAGIFLIIFIIWFLHFLWTLFKIFKTLLTAYINLVLRIAVGPLQIMLDLVPSQSGFQPWLMAIIAESSVFVVVPIMLYLQYFFSGTNSFGVLQTVPSEDWVTLGGLGLKLPFLGANLTGGTGTLSFGFRFIISYFIFALTPKAADIIKETLKVPIFKYGNILDVESQQVFGNVLKYEEMTKKGTLPPTWSVGDKLGAQFDDIGKTLKDLRRFGRPPKKTSP